MHSACRGRLEDNFQRSVLFHHEILESNIGLRVHVVSAFTLRATSQAPNSHLSNMHEIKFCHCENGKDLFL